MSVAGAARDPARPRRDRPTEGESPPRAGAILTVLILGAVVANINLAIANVALPSIGAALDTSQAELNLVAVGFTLGLAASVLYLGALADRYGRKPAMMLGAALSIPASLLAAWAPNATVLIVARVSGGVAAGLLYPITLSLITGLFRGGAHPRDRAVVGHRGWLLGAGPPGRWAAAGPLLVGVGVPALRADRGAGGRAGRPVAAPARGGVQRAGRPPRRGPVGGVHRSAGAGDQPGAQLWLQRHRPGAVRGLAGRAGFVRGARAARLQPLFDLKVLRARTFTIALVGGTITWGGLLGATFIGQQYTQNVLGYSPLSAAMITLPAAVFVAAGARPAGRMITSRGSRVPLALGLAVTAVGFGGMALLFGTTASAVVVGIVYGVLGLGIGLAGPPSSSSLMGSVPVARAGMGSASNDLQRDFGGALFQAVMGTLLAVEYTSYFTKAFAALPRNRPSSCPSRRSRPSASRSPAPSRSPSSSPRPRPSSSSPPPSRRSSTARRPPSCSP